MKRFLLSAIILLFPLAVLSCNKTPEGGETPEEKVPAVPTGVKLHSATTTSLTFQWTAVSGADSYTWKLTQGGSQVKSANASGRNVSIDGLTPGTAYAFSVCANAGGKSSAYSTAVEAMTEGNAPTPPDPEAETICVDATLVLELDSAPVLGNSGLIRIYTSDGTEVDRIDLADLATVDILESGVTVPKTQMKNDSKFTSFMDALGCGKRYRIVNCTPLRVKGNTLEIRPHYGVLDFSSSYFVTMDAGVIQGHHGIEPGKWTFSTEARPKDDTRLRVAADGSGDFCTLQRALGFANASGATIFLAEGTYEGCLYLRDKNGITIKGDDRENVRIVYPNNESYANGSGGGATSRPTLGAEVGTNGGRSLFLVENCDNFVMEDLTIENAFFVSDHKGQAECIYFNSGSNTHKMTIENCSLLSWQDTFLTKGRVWVHNSLIAGHVDFIWGYPEVCLFENCEIRARAGGYIIQARVPKLTDTGFVFLNCSLTAESGVADGSMYLARSGGSTDYYDNVVFVNCKMSSVINKAGWHPDKAPNPNPPTATSGWREYGSVDASGKAVTGHNPLGKVLTAAEAEPYSSREKVLGW